MKAFFSERKDDLVVLKWLGNWIDPISPAAKLSYKSCWFSLRKAYKNSKMDSFLFYRIRKVMYLILQKKFSCQFLHDFTKYYEIENGNYLIVLFARQFFAKILEFRHRESNPGLLGESQLSWPLDHAGIYVQQNELNFELPPK